jgi:hypothetical protein
MGLLGFVTQYLGNQDKRRCVQVPLFSHGLFVFVSVFSMASMCFL